MIKLIYKKSILVDEVLVEKAYACEVDLIRSSEEGSDVKLTMFDVDSDSVIEEVLTVQGDIRTLDGLTTYLLGTPYFTLDA